MDELREMLATLERTSPTLTARVALSVLATGSNTSKLSSNARTQLQAFSATPARVPTVGEVVACVLPLDPPALSRKCTGTGTCRNASCQVCCDVYDVQLSLYQHQPGLQTPTVVTSHMLLVAAVYRCAVPNVRERAKADACAAFVQRMESFMASHRGLSPMAKCTGVLLCALERKRSAAVL